MTTQEWLLHANALLSGSETPSIDTAVLLCDELDKNKAWVFAHFEDELSDYSVRKLNAQVKRRSLGEPLAYIRGKVEFYGREFYVDKYVLTPRPESEAIIDLAKKLMTKKRPNVADIGSGSGALGICVALEIKESRLTCIDIDEDTLKVAKRNAEKHDVKAKFCVSDLLNNSGIYDLLLCNLPYVPNNYEINLSASHEPAHALFGGEDGLDLYRKLFKQLAGDSRSTPLVLTESLPFQHESLADVAKECGYEQIGEQDLVQAFSKV